MTALLIRWVSISCITFCIMLACAILLTFSSTCNGSGGLACLWPLVLIGYFGWWVIPIIVAAILGIIEAIKRFRIISR